MYLHLGQGLVVRDRDVIGIFDLDITSQSYRTRQYLSRAERAGQVETAGEELPRSFVVCRGRGGQRVCLAGPTSGTLARRCIRPRLDSNKISDFV